jgi:hypothetical protein
VVHKSLDRRGLGLIDASRNATTYCIKLLRGLWLELWLELWLQWLRSIRHAAITIAVVLAHDASKDTVNASKVSETMKGTQHEETRRQHTETAQEHSIGKFVSESSKSGNFHSKRLWNFHPLTSFHLFIVSLPCSRSQHTAASCRSVGRPLYLCAIVELVQARVVVADTMDVVVQISALLGKGFKLGYRNWLGTAIRLLVPALMLFIPWLTMQNLASPSCMQYTCATSVLLMVGIIRSSDHVVVPRSVHTSNHCHS